MTDLQVVLKGDTEHSTTVSPSTVNYKRSNCARTRRSGPTTYRRTPARAGTPGHPSARGDEIQADNGEGFGAGSTWPVPFHGSTWGLAPIPPASPSRSSSSWRLQNSRHAASDRARREAIKNPQAGPQRGPQARQPGQAGAHHHATPRRASGPGPA